MFSRLKMFFTFFFLFLIWKVKMLIKKYKFEINARNMLQKQNDTVQKHSESGEPGDKTEYHYWSAVAFWPLGSISLKYRTFFRLKSLPLLRNISHRLQIKRSSVIYHYYSIHLLLKFWVILGIICEPWGFMFFFKM